MVEIQLKVRFVFVLLGPKNDNIDYLEIGRCIGTLMTNKVSSVERKMLFGYFSSSMFVEICIGFS